MKKATIFSFSLFMILFGIIAISSASSGERTCGDFKKWTVAQQRYDRDPEKWKHLDGHSGVRGVVCESLKEKQK
jgi:hypothetical protein